MAWCPFATRDPAGSNVSAGGYVPGHHRKGGLHTTEGQTYMGARGAYSANNSWPHFTVSSEGGLMRYWQHIDTDLAARAARNLSGGHETNRDGLVQIEIVGTCNPPNKGKSGWVFIPEAPRTYLNGIARLMRWIEENAGVQRYATERWKPYPESYGGGNGVRMPLNVWHGFRGWCGHQHFPENTHGDPGNIDIQYLLGNDPITPGEAKMRVPNAVAAHTRPGAGGQVIVMARDGAIYAFGGAPYIDAYNRHPHLWGGSTPESVRAGLDFEWHPDGNGYAQLFDDGAVYHWRLP